VTKPKILLSGASGTGKTTVAKYLSEKYDVPRMSFPGPNGEDWSAARYTAWTIIGKPRPYDVPDRSQFQLKLIKVMGDWIDEHKDTGYVSDRGDADQWAYSCLHGPDELRDNPAIFRDAISRSDQTLAVCYMSRFFHLGDDSARKEATAYHRATEALIECYLWHFAGLRDGIGWVRLETLVNSQEFEAWRDGKAVFVKPATERPCSG
jgi:hypothetical protein